MRSMMRHVAKQYGIEEFYQNYVAIIRDTVLGVSPAEGGERPGRTYDENGMHIYQLEVLDAQIEDSHVAQLLTRAQHDAVDTAINLASQERRLDMTKRSAQYSRETAQVEAETASIRNQLRAKTQLEEHTLEMEGRKRELEAKLEEIKVEAESAAAQQAADLLSEQKRTEINEVTLARDKARRDQEDEFAKAELRRRTDELEAQTKAMVDKAKAFAPDLIAALRAFGDQDLAARAAEAMAPMALLGGKSVAEVLQNLFKGTALERGLKENIAKLMEAAGSAADD
jgi:major vault protein